MSDIAIRVENLSKQYRIGGPQARYKTIRKSLTKAVQAPFRRLSSVARGQSSAVSDETIWVLKDVSFEVKRGEVVGIPSTALRRSSGQGSGQALGATGLRRELSRAIHGRLGSLLEACPECNRRVGTGFHPTPLCPRKQGEDRAGEHLPQRRHPFDDAQGRPGYEAGGDLS
jgi:lipopolysaccharide transport system ATP-binding protein